MGVKRDDAWEALRMQQAEFYAARTKIKGVWAKLIAQEKVPSGEIVETWKTARGYYVTEKATDGRLSRIRGPLKKEEIDDVVDDYVTAPISYILKASEWELEDIEDFERRGLK